MKPLILRHLSLRDFARAASCCRELRTAYRLRLAEERIQLIAFAKENYGTGLEDKVIPLIRQAMSDWKQSAFASEQQHFSLGPLGVGSTVQSADVYPLQPGPEVLAAFFDANSEQGRRSIRFHVFKFERNDVHLSVIASMEVARVTLALLFATCTANPEVMPAGWQGPHTITLSLSRVPPGARGQHEAESLIAPLRELAESVVINPDGKYVTVNPNCHLRGLEQATEPRHRFPLGHLKVRLFPSRCCYNSGSVGKNRKVTS